MTLVQNWFVRLWSTQELPENHERLRNNGNFYCWLTTEAGGGRETGNLFGVALSIPKSVWRCSLNWFLDWLTTISYCMCNKYSQWALIIKFEFYDGWILLVIYCICATWTNLKTSVQGISQFLQFFVPNVMIKWWDLVVMVLLYKSTYDSVPIFASKI